jgi:chromosome segregation ATPase
MNEKESYRKKVEAQLNQLNAEIAELVGRLEKGIDKEVESLRPRLKAARDKLKELKRTSNEAWGDLKPGLENAWNELQKSINEATARFKKHGRRKD